MSSRRTAEERRDHRDALRAELRERQRARGESDRGVIDSIVAMFAPFTPIAKELQLMFQLERPPGIRTEHGRLEILIRGTGMSGAPLPDRVALAHQISEVSRPLLRQSPKRDRRRYADRAIAVCFEDEQATETGIATTRFSYVALLPGETR